MEKNAQISDKKQTGDLKWEDMQDYFTSGRIGFWKLELETGKKNRMYVDSNMRNLIGLPKGLSPEENYSFFYAHIYDDDRYLIKEFKTDIEKGEAVVEYRYYHPSEGEKHIRCSGKNIISQESCITIMGYDQELSEVIHVGQNVQRKNQLLRQNHKLELKQSRTDDYYRNLMDMVICGVISYTVAEHRLLHMNAEALRICGVKDIAEAQKHMFKIWKNVFYPDPNVPEKLKNICVDGGMVDYECTITDISGNTANVMARSEVFSSPQEELCVVTTFLDVSESVVLKNEKKVLEMLCTDYTGVYLCDLNTDSVIAVNPTMSADEQQGEKKLGLKIHSFSARTQYAYENMLVQESAPDFLEKINRSYLMEYLSAHPRFTYRFRMKPNPSGHEYFEIQIVRLNSEDEFKVIMGFHYIDDVIREEERHKIQLENTLAESNKKNKVIVAISKLYWQVFSVDLRTDTYKEVFTKGQFTLDNPQFVGIAHADFLQAVNDFVDDAYKSRMAEFLDHKTLQDRLSEVETITMEYQAKMGFWVSARYIVQSRDSDRKVTEVLFLLQQIDEQKRKELEYQNELEKTAEEARKANEAKTNFLRRMSHDIRTPLNGILGLIKIDEAHFDDLDLVKENHRKMKISASYLLSLINDVLQTSKLKDGKVQLTHEVIKLTDLTMDIVNIIIGRATEAGIKWEYEKWKRNIPYPFIYGSPVHLRQIFLNIYGNCIKYNRPGGKITTTVDTLPEHDGICTYRWIISDTGIGMSPEFLKHIFDPFAQEKMSARSTYQGIGLGMFIVKSLIDQMGGTIKITSQEGVGSTFEIVIPFEIAQAPVEVAVQPTADENAIRGLNIMLVEDNELNAEIARVLLMDEGAEITVVTDGQQAVDLFKSSPQGTFDAILMDVMMPVMDGLTATETIRALERPDARTIPIIAMTANAFKEDEQKCLEAGMNAHLAKPLDMEKVKQTIQLTINHVPGKNDRSFK